MQRKLMQCPTPGQYFATTRPPVTVPVEIRPGGAKGQIVVLGDFAEPRRPDPRGPPELQEVLRLKCGEETFAHRPAGCRVTRGVVVAAGRPRPRTVRLPARTGCLIWGNKGPRQVAVESERGSAYFFSVSALFPGEAKSRTFFSSAPPGRISYGIEPGGARGTVVLD